MALTHKQRNRKYYNLQVKNKGTCEKCGGPCNRKSKKCKYCHNSEQGKFIGRLMQERRYSQ